MKQYDTSGMLTRFDYKTSSNGQINIKNLNKNLNNSQIIRKPDLISPRNEGTMFSFNTANMANEFE